MYLRFNQGAIVVLELRGFDKPTSIIGMVVNVLPDEVELYPQSLLLYTISDLDQFCTSNNGTPIHVRRKLICNWKYATLADITSRIQFSNEKRYNEYISKLHSENKLNYFGSDGFCRGDGPYFGNIKEESSINANLLEDDGK